MTPVLYIKPLCPWCIKAVAAFEQRGIRAEIRDVTRDAAAFRRMVEISGQSKCPTFECGDFVVADFDMAEFDAAVAKKRPTLQ